MPNLPFNHERFDDEPLYLDFLRAVENFDYLLRGILSVDQVSYFKLSQTISINSIHGHQWENIDAALALVPELNIRNQCAGDYGWMTIEYGLRK